MVKNSLFPSTTQFHYIEYSTLGCNQSHQRATRSKRRTRVLFAVPFTDYFIGARQLKRCWEGEYSLTQPLQVTHATPGNEAGSQWNCSQRMAHSLQSTTRSQLPFCGAMPMTSPPDAAGSRRSAAWPCPSSMRSRQVTPPTKNGHAPPPTKSRKSSQSVNPLCSPFYLVYSSGARPSAKRPLRASELWLRYLTVTEKSRFPDPTINRSRSVPATNTPDNSLGMPALR
ncbi:hypothetical protein FPOAC1_004421 [Fusarium poae]|uniref:hypothetical protein n=1 Tax=Fusarium poae TaxID=36050 RepID=UPI001CE894D8|nr:hypothetical protein FPOAC1_004421 [Fusarium poae]KAG8671182.1 hypothetical protein FPOAC1_004421 [Fusarium poae]